MRYPAIATVLACAAIVACTGGARDASRIDEGPSVADLRRVAATVTDVRGLPERQRTEIALVGEREFVEALRASRPVGVHYSISGPSEAVDGLDGAARLLAEEARTIEREETIAFYDPDRRTIFLRRPRRGEPSLPLSWVLAHEMGHALQHQYFPLLDRLASEDSEARLAYRALLEGDAMVTMLAYAADSSWMTVNRMVANALSEIEHGRLSAVTRVGIASALSSAPPLIRERFLFPYTAGTAFVARIHRAGGFDLVNRLYARPPVTTEQVLHPQKYLDREMPVVFSEIPVPDGAKPIARGRFGELHVSGLLASCVGRALAVDAAAGWGGDAFTISEIGDRIVTVWSTAWDTDVDAEEFEGAVSRCFRQRAPESVMRRGRRVSVLIGLPSEDLRAMHESVLGADIEMVTSDAPIRAVLRPFRRVQKVAAPYVAENTYFDARLGIEVPVPRGFSPSVGKKSLFAEQQSGRVGLLVVGLSEWIVTSKSVQRLYSDLTSDIERHLDGRRLAVVSNSRTMTALGSGLERTWALEGGHLSARMVVAPICGGAGAVIYLSMWADPDTEERLRGAVAGTRSTTADRPVCAELDP